MNKLEELAKRVDEIARQLGFEVERTVENIAFYHYKENGEYKTNAKGETLIVDVGYCSNFGKGKFDLPWSWYKSGKTAEFMPEYWGLNTYVTDKDGQCWGGYNPTVKPSEDQKRQVIDFDWHFSATEENFKKLLEEVLRRFNTPDSERERQDFVKKHKKFVHLRSQSIWNGEQLKQHFTQPELINHLLLSEEMYYLWRENDVAKILDYVQDAYPETTVEDVRRVYEANKDFICSIYG